MLAIFYDNDILSSFLMIRRGDILKKLFDKIIIPDKVYEELTHPNSPDYVKIKLNNLIRENFIEIYEIKLFSREKELYDSIIKENRIGKGEASVIAAAMNNNGMIASNNIVDVKYYIKKYNLPLLTSSIILTKLYEKEIITKYQAEDYWKKMLNHNRRLPTESFSEYYKKLFKKDYEEFNREKYYKEL